MHHSELNESTSSSPGNLSQKGKNKMQEEDKGNIISPTPSDIVELDSGIQTPFGSAMSSGSGEITCIDDLNAYSDSNMNHVEKDQVIRKYLDFQKFDIVEDYSHHYYKGSNLEEMKPQKQWIKQIQQEWRVLEKDLPDTIYVRVYESRMDLLRAVIKGAKGTPYHDGLFFFDVFFPNNYPSVPPKVHYHSGGLRINPNLYCNGKVCLSLLNTWNGKRDEKWTPGTSTILQVLVSIQGLVLNAKPYFNEPGYAKSSGSNRGEYQSTIYNEETVIKSLTTMVYTMRRPPKNFEDFVIGHFTVSADTILTTCRDYIEGAGVRCGDKGAKTEGSLKFRKDVEHYIKILIGALKGIGLDNLDRFIPKVQLELVPKPELVPKTKSRSLAQKIKAFFCLKK